MALNKTNLVLVGSPLLPDFIGTPQEFFEAILERLSIQSPVGTNFFVTGDVEPSSNVGPWLKGGTQWWVFDTESGRYIPLDITASQARLFFFGPNNPGTPTSSDPIIWLRTNQDRIVGLYGWSGTAWLASSGAVNSGATLDRPTIPVDGEQFFDTDINVGLIWNRGAWRTLDGSPGDVKSVTHTTLTEALRYNPGWAYYGDTDQTLRGKVISGATKDPGATPESSFATASGITARAAGDQFGEETHVITSGEIESHTHTLGHKNALAGSTIILLHGVDDGADVALPTPVPTAHIQGGGSTFTKVAGSTGDGPTGTAMVTSRQLTLANQPNLTTAAAAHNNIQPCVALWTLYKT